MRLEGRVMPEIHIRALENRITIPNRISKLVNLHTSNGDYLRDMFGEQFSYGHREILLKHCGLDYSTQLIGNLQHGVFGPEDRIDFRTPRYLSGRRTHFWVYSKETETQGRSEGFKNVVAIGSPWLYLREAVARNEQALESTAGILVMPSHSQTSIVSSSSVIQKQERAKSFRKIIGTQKATVLLHAVDICDPETTEAYLDEGFRVLCIGSSSHIPRWSPSGNRIRSLHKLMSLMRTHTHLLTDDYGTHLFYAINMNMKIGIYPEIREHSSLEEFSSGRTIDQDALDSASIMRFLERKMPDSINQFTGSEKYQGIANELLGKESILNSAELLETLVYRKNIFPISSVQPW